MSHEDWDNPVEEKESFDYALPVRVERAPEPERYIIGCCFMDQGQTLDQMVQAGLSSGDFIDESLGKIFGVMRVMRDKKLPIDLETLVQELGPRINDVGGIVTLMDLDDPIKIGTTSKASHYVGKILQESANRRELARARDIIDRSARGEDVGRIGVRPEKTKPRPITSYAYPSDDDPNTLLGNDDYLGRGGGMLFVSHAGAGKSSWIMDACMMWAIGRPWMGIKCNGPLKSIIIQAEDSDRYIGKIFASFAHVNRLTEAELSLLSKNCIIIRLKGVSGPAFESELEQLVKDHAPDLVIINPVYLYADGDISRSEFAQPFLVGLDRVNKEEKFGYILIHHTGKPAKKDGKTKELDDWESAYMGFGSSYFANWPRCTALLEPIQGHNGRFAVKLGKGGLNAGITKSVPQGSGFRQEPVTRINIKHSAERMDVHGKSKPVYYWEMDSEAIEGKEAVTKKSGRPQKYVFSQIRDIFPEPNEPGRTFPVLMSFARSKIGIGETALRDLVNEAVRDGLVKVTQVSTGYVHNIILPGA